MKKYSIVRIGREYVVRADQQDVLKVASRRQAAKLVTDAAELLDSQSAPSLQAAVQDGSSIEGDPKALPDPSEVS